MRVRWRNGSDGRATAAAAIDELLDAAIVRRDTRRGASGRFDGVCYSAVRSAKPSPSATASLVLLADPLSNGPATDFTGNGQNGDKRKISHHELHKNPSYVLQKSYASSTDNDDLCLLAAICFERSDIIDEAFKSPSLLGWIEGIDPGNPAQDLADIDPATLDEVLAAVKATALADSIRAATRRRVSAELLRPSGLYAVCHLAAGVRRWKKALTAAQALDVVLAAIAERIGNRGGWLNSLSVIGHRLAGEILHGRDPEQVFAAARERADPHIADLRRADGARVLAPHLFEEDRAHLGQLLLEYGEGAVATIRSILTRCMIDGPPPGSVTTWAYFRPVLDEQRLADQMADEGMRPGDVFCAHRQRQIEG